MKRKKAIQHRITQKTATRKRARLHRRGEFRAKAKDQRIKTHKRIQEAMTKAQAEAAETPKEE